jgi:hypothetical protein
MALPRKLLLSLAERAADAVVIAILCAAVGLVALARLRVGFPEENAPWVTWIAGPVEDQDWGGEGLSTGTLELQLVPKLGPYWIDTPTTHLTRVSPGPRQNIVEYPFTDAFGRARLVRIPAGSYVLGRGGGSEAVNLEEMLVEVRPGQTTRATLGR